MHLGAPGTDKVRNVVLVGHGGAGKTSLAEAMLYLSGATKRLGTVDDGHSGLDYDPEEIKRKFSINLSLAPVVHDGVKINVIDTPGYADFVGDAIAGMEAAEMALFVVDAVAGPQVQTERLWRDRRRDGHRPRRVHQPHGQGARGLRRRSWRRSTPSSGTASAPSRSRWAQEADFRGVIDVIRMKAYHHEGDKEEVLDIPDEFADAAEAAREKLTDLVAEADESLMEKYLEGETLTQEELETLLDKAIAQGIFIPVFVGSALKLQGIEDLMDEIVSFFPEPTAHGPIPTADGGEVHVTTEGATARPRLQDDLRPVRGPPELREGRSRAR